MEKKRIRTRLNKIKGQINGVTKMIDDDRDCGEVLKQLSAATGAIKSLSMILLENHMKCCVSDAIKNEENETEIIEEVIEIVKQFSK